MSKFIGLMSGTSCDGVDLSCVQINFTQQQYFPKISLEAFKTYPYPDKLRLLLLSLAEKKQMSIDNLGQLNTQVSQFYSHLINKFCCEFTLTSIDAIGIHGHNLRHNSSNKIPFPYSWQLGNETLIAKKTGLNVVGQIRQSDIVNGGQGAPLTPVLHQLLCNKNNHFNDSMVINLGGICNITLLSSNKIFSAFDVGPANTLLDSVIRDKNININYDKNGNIARSGKVHHSLLELMLREPYFSYPAPKSTGRELFNLHWFNEKLVQIDDDISFESKLTTLVELTAITLNNSLPKGFIAKSIYFCGGGKHNDYLCQRIIQNLPNNPNILDLPMNGDAIESACWAYFAYCHMNNIKIDLSSVTGSNKATVLGVLAPC